LEGKGSITIPFLDAEVNIIPFQAWRSPEVSRKLKLPDFKTIGKLMW
jgi:hypothetical protein